LFGLSAPAFCESCPPPLEGYNAVVEVQVDFSLEDPAYSQQWVFDSLQPDLQETGSHPFDLWRFFGGFTNHLTHFYTTVGQLHHEVFCWAKKDVDEKFQALEYTFASHNASFSPRPVQWESAPREDKKGRKYSYGIMGPINYVYSGDPDWLILKGAEWLTDAGGHSIVEIEIVNFRSRMDPGGEVKLFLSNTDKDGRCSARPEKPTEVPVTFSAGTCERPAHSRDASTMRSNESCRVQVAAPDPGDLRPIKREIRIDKGGCGELDADIDLGPTGVLNPGSSTKLRYVFNVNLDPSKSSKITSARSSPDLRLLSLMKHRSIQVRQTSIYPTRGKTMTLAGDH
jgi:hypothetical protein